jgi:acetoin utilization protein AcuB
VADALARDGAAVIVLEWAALRGTVLDACPSSADVEIGHRALACTAAELAAAGFLVIVDATAPRRAWRELGRALVGRFAEVQLACPAAVCADRERAVRWRPHPGRPSVFAEAEWPLDYEYAVAPDLVIDTAARSEWTATEDVLRLARRLLAHQGGPEEEPAMHVRDLMTSKPLTVAPDTPMLEARQRMLEERIRHLIVTDGAEVVGIVTDRDIRLNLPSPATSLSVWEVNYLLAKLTVRDVMTRSVLVVDPDRPAAEAARILIDHKISALPVTQDGRLLGIVTESDFVRVVARRDTAP